jgi:hypothetical protein
MASPQQGEPSGVGAGGEHAKVTLPAPTPIPVQVAALPEQSRDPAVLLQIQASLITQFWGPLPHPDALARFEQIVPGSAKKILAMAEAQASHRQNLERKVVEGDVQRSWWGLWAGFTLGITGMNGGRRRSGSAGPLLSWRSIRWRNACYLSQRVCHWDEKQARGAR